MKDKSFLEKVLTTIAVELAIIIFFLIMGALIAP
jgi:hypothetical protein